MEADSGTRMMAAKHIVLPKWKRKLEDPICSLQILMSLSKVCKLDPHENEI